jgi:hypothetical protein
MPISSRVQDFVILLTSTGPVDLGKHIIRTEGYQALFRGYMATNLRDSLASMAYFSTYEYLKFTLLPPGKL